MCVYSCVCLVFCQLGTSAGLGWLIKGLKSCVVYIESSIVAKGALVKTNSLQLDCQFILITLCWNHNAKYKVETTQNIIKLTKKN
jgi:hypothetical protein